MPTDLENTVAVQADPATGNISTDSGSMANGEQSGVQSQQNDNAQDQLGPQGLPPELEETKKQLLRDYHEKTKKLSEDKVRFEREVETMRNDSSTLRELVSQPWFQKAAQDERERRSGRPEDVPLTEEDFEAMKTDKEAFKRGVLSMVDRIVNSRVSPAINQQQQTLQQMNTEREFQRVASNYKDFRDLNDQKLLDPYFEKGMDFETAYKAYKYDHEISNLDKKAQEKANEILRQSREGAVAQSGRTQVSSGSMKIKARSFEDAFDKAFDLMKRGNSNFTMDKE